MIQKNEYRLSTSKSRKLNIVYKKYDINLAHDKILLEGINYIEQLSNINKVKEENGTWFIKENDYEKEHLIVKPIQTLSSAIENFIINLIIIISIFAFLIVIIMLIIFTCRLNRIMKRRKNNKVHFNTLNETVELEVTNTHETKELLSELNNNELFQRGNAETKASIISLISQ